MRDAVVGSWLREGEAILSPINAAAVLQLPYLPPDQYDLTLEVQQVSGNGGLVLGLRVDRRQVTAVLGLGGNVTGLSTEDSLRFPDPRTRHEGPIFTQGKPATIVCRVRRQRLTIEADGRRVIDYKGDLRRLSAVDLWSVPNENVLFIGTKVTSYRFTQIDLEPVAASDSEL